MIKRFGKTQQKLITLQINKYDNLVNNIKVTPVIKWCNFYVNLLYS